MAPAPAKTSANAARPSARARRDSVGRSGTSRKALRSGAAHIGCTLRSAAASGLAAAARLNLGGLNASVARVLGVLLTREDFPGCAVGVADPDLVLAGVAAGGFQLVKGGEASIAKTLLGCEHGVCVRDLD